MVVVPITTTASDVTQSMMDSARIGLDYIVENADYVEKLASALDSKNCIVKKQVFELLSALSVYNSDGYNRTLQALEYFKSQMGQRYRFKFIISELRNAPTVEYQTAVLAFINCLILATPELRERMRVRAEFIGLRLLNVLGNLRHRNKDYTDLVVQLDVFDEQRESDESQISPASHGIDLSSSPEVFDAIIRQISDTPQEIPFLCILQHLLRIDVSEPISDLIWDAAERIVNVHRATLLESPEDALRLLKVPSHAKSLHKLKESPPPPPPPPPCGVPPPPPPPPSGPLVPEIPGLPRLPNSCNEKSNRSSERSTQAQLKLPQQSIPMPKTKMRTVNWNKIPSGKILAGDQNNMWATLAKSHSSSTVDLDWSVLEGLFCIQSEKVNSALNISNSGHSRNDELDRRNPKRDEVILLDAKRTLNINIFLKQFRSSNEDMVQLIQNGSSEDFGTERLRGLLKILPSKDEIDLLESISDTDKQRLGIAEKFLVQLIQIVGYRLRIESMLLKEELETCFRSLELSITSILQAARDIKESQELQEVIFMILVAGNFLNSGGYAGDAAAGIKLSSLQKIAEIRGNKPGVYLLHFVASHAESRNPRLITFADDMPALEEASKTSIDQLSAEILSLNSKVTNISQQMENPSVPRDIILQFFNFFKEAHLRIDQLRNYLPKIEDIRVDLARFFCEDLHTFKLEDCFRILFTFTTRLKLASIENDRRKKHEKEVEIRRKAREDQFKKRSQLGWQSQHSGEDIVLNMDRNKGIALTPEDDIFIACSPRIVRRRLGSMSDNNGNINENISNDQLVLQSPETTPNGSLRRRRSRAPSDDDGARSGLMDFLRTSGTDGSSGKRSANEQYGSLDRSWSRKTRRRPNLMDFVNDERERPVSPGPANQDFKPSSTSTSGQTERQSLEAKHESPTREWRKRIAAWFVDLENGGSGEIPKRQPPPRRFQRRFGLDTRSDGGSWSLATLPEGDIGQEEDSNMTLRAYQQRVHPDRKPSLTLNTEAIEEVQSPLKDNRLMARPSLNPIEKETNKEKSLPALVENTDNSRRTLIGSLGSQDSEEKLVLYIPENGTVSKSSQDKTIRAANKLNCTSFLNRNIGSNAGTKDGFDRFASIRRSRRIKKPDTASPVSTTKTEKSTVRNSHTRFVSKVDITADPLPMIESKPSGSASDERPNRDYAKTEQVSNRSNPQIATMINTDGHSPIKGSAPATEDKNLLSRKSSITFSTESGEDKKVTINSSSGLTDRDEGFEESQSSLSESNSQIDPITTNGFNGFSRSRFRRSVREPGAAPSASLWSTRTGINSTPTPAIRRNSLQDNSPSQIFSHTVNNNNKANSRTSLLSSRSSLTSQVTVNTIRDASEQKSRKSSKSEDLYLYSSNKRGANVSVKTNGQVTPKNMSTHQNSKNDSFNGVQNHSNLESELHKAENVKPISRGLAPRLLSFMRPTASSAAKDKVDTVKVKKRNSITKSFK